METRSFFHHPDVSLPVVRRRVAQQLLELLGLFGEAALTRGRSLTWNHSFPSRHAYHAAVGRLRKLGLVVDRPVGDGRTVLALTAAGEERLPAACRPEPLWRARWNGLWYVLVYDVPEGRRRYRNALRNFLERMRMGCLQRSVWVSPRDIRPEYDDLKQAAGVDTVSFLFEARTVLGQKARDIVRTAWDFRRLQQIQAWYIDIYTEALARVAADALSEDELIDLSEEELTAYLTAMAEDPLLPRKLCPSDYCGRDAYRLHRKLTTEIGRRL